MEWQPRPSIKVGHGIKTFTCTTAMPCNLDTAIKVLGDNKGRSIRMLQWIGNVIYYYGLGTSSGVGGANVHVLESSNTLAAYNPSSKYIFICKKGPNFRRWNGEDDIEHKWRYVPVAQLAGTSPYYVRDYTPTAMVSVEAVSYTHLTLPTKA